ncbi:hypothetical protein HZ326_2472 [Fusarium oxysporum f. sp. albedinis]|nr:hypothetical protein HZ326_2472 [Fusarium oxysporum f. sp. albedinis]
MLNSLDLHESLAAGLQHGVAESGISVDELLFTTSGLAKRTKEEHHLSKVENERTVNLGRRTMRESGI